MKALIQSPTPNLEQSLNFYSRLGYTVVASGDHQIVSDGKALIQINPSRFARAGFKLYASEWTSIVEKLESFTSVMKTDDGYLFSDPSGVWIYLINGEPEFSIDLSEISASVLGNYMGISLESVDLLRSVKIYETLGLKVTMGSEENGWIALMNEEGFGVSIMKPLSCPHLFFNPSFTFFNGGENMKIIEEVRKREIPITEEITHFNKEGIVDNIIIRDPGGFGFFIFND